MLGLDKYGNVRILASKYVHTGNSTFESTTAFGDRWAYVAH